MKPLSVGSCCSDFRELLLGLGVVEYFGNGCRGQAAAHGMDDTVDKLRLMEGKKPSVRKSVHMAYDRAMAHLNHVRVNLNFNPSNFI
ncbi:hypothetical protein CRUP_022046 [Coryphaenoides rupestris]|nr:hypothetical protein CRUP_022046 [Coryphaenoides rupestris]